MFAAFLSWAAVFILFSLVILERLPQPQKFFAFMNVATKMLRRLRSCTAMTPYCLRNHNNDNYTKAVKQKTAIC